MQKKTTKPPAKTAKKKKPPVKKQDQKFSLKRLIMGEEKPDLTELETGEGVNRSQMWDVGDTRQDFEELDSAISSGLYLKDAMNRQGEDFYYMNTLIEVTADDPETLEQRVTAVEKLCVSIDMIARRCDYKYTNGNCWIGGFSEAGKTFTLQCLGGRLRQQGKRVIFIVPKRQPAAPW